MLRAVGIAFWFIVSGYLAIGAGIEAHTEASIQEVPAVQGENAVIYKGVSFKNRVELQNFKDAQELQSLVRFFPWPSALPPIGSLFALAIAMGLLGSAGRLLYEHVHQDTPLASLPVWAGPPLGAVTGLLIMCAAYVVPSALTVDFTNLRPVSVAALALFGGFSSLHVLEWIENKVIKPLFPKME